jgi:hypothetical protein
VPTANLNSDLPEMIGVTRLPGLSGSMPFIPPQPAAPRCMFRSCAAVELEILALRRQIGIVQRAASRRPRLTRADRVLWVASFPNLEGLALGTGYRQTRDCDRLVPPRVSAVLDLEGSARKSRPPSRFVRGSRFW